jgi:hypothetical protein
MTDTNTHITETDTENPDGDYGYMICLSNVSMPNILNIGITWIVPKQKIDDINGLFGLWKPPTPYILEFAKKVLNIEHKRNTIYKLLSEYRINQKQRFFHVPIEKVRTLFDLMDGDYWVNTSMIKSTDDTEGIEGTKGIEGTDDIFDIPVNESVKAAKIIEDRMIDCLFKKCDDLEAKIENKKVELAEINAIIEERKVALRDLSNNSKGCETRDQTENYIVTEY